MSEQNAEQVTEQQTQPQAGQQPAAPEKATETPPWGDAANFDPEKAWKLIEGLKADKEKLSAREVLTDDQKAKLAEYERLEEASKTELERANEQVTRWQSEAEKWRTSSVASRIEALAAADFADVSDAASALDPSKYLDAGGAIDEAAIRADLAELLERKPHWRRSAEVQSPRLPAPNAAQGSGSGKSGADPASEFAALIGQQLR